jgi:hypothetical protein
MVIVVAALDAWTSSGPADPAAPEDILGQHTNLILAEVFQFVEARVFPENHYINNGLGRKLLRADIGFWRAHAKDRGIDVAMASAIRSEPALSGLKSSSDTTRNYSTEMVELVKLLIWLLETRDPSSRVSNAAVYGVAILLRRVGTKIETRQNLPSIDDPRRVVYLMGNTGINDSALTV